MVRSPSIALSVHRRRRKCEAEDRSPTWVLTATKLATMRLHYRAADRKTKTHPVPLGRMEWFEQVLEDLTRDARAAVRHADFHGRDIKKARRHHELRNGRIGHRFACVADEIDEHLLDLYSVGEYLGGIAVEGEARLDGPCADAGRQRTGL